jgi:hypothetical protein
MIYQYSINASEVVKLFKQGQVIQVREEKNNNPDYVIDYGCATKLKGYWHNNKDGITYMESLIQWKKIQAVRMIDNAYYKVVY